MDISLDGSNSRLLINHPPGSSSMNETNVGLATFQFKTIGQPPALLQRLSASALEDKHAQNPDGYSRSPSPDLEDELLLSDSSPETLNTEQPSLRARIAMSEPDKPSNGTHTNVPNPEESAAFSADPSKTASGESSIRPSGVPKPQMTHHHSTSTCASNTANALSSKKSDEFRVNAVPQRSFKNSSLASDIKAVSSRQHLPVISKPPTIPTNDPLTIVPYTEIPTLKSLRDLQLRLSSTNLTTYFTESADVLWLTNILKDRCVELLSTSRNARDLAQRSIASARESMEASLKSLEVAESLQTQTDELIASVARMSSGLDKEWTDAIVPLRTHVQQLVEQIGEKELHDAEVRRQTEQRQKATEAEAAERARSQSALPVDTSVPAVPSSDTPGFQPQNVENPILQVEDVGALFRIKREAAMASQELIRKREETEARQRVAEAKLRQHRETEDVLERQKQQAKTELDLLESKYKQAQAERMEAEEKEMLQQQEDMRLTAMKEDEKKRKDDETARLLSEERSKQIVHESQQRRTEEREKLSREAFLRDKLDKEKMAREEEQKKKGNEVKQQLPTKSEEGIDLNEQLRQQNVKRQEVHAQKLRAMQAAAQKIHATKAGNSSTQGQHDHNPRIGQSAVSNSPTAMAHLDVDLPLTNDLSRKTFSGGNPNAPHDYSKVPSRSLLTTPLTKGSPSLSQITAPDNSKHKSIPPALCRSNIPKNLQPGGLPSPPFEENISSGDHLGGEGGPSIVESPAVGRLLDETSAADQNYGNASLVPLVPQSQNPNSPSTPPSSLALIDSRHIFTESRGRDTGNLPLLSRSQTTPISPDAQKSNLRNLIKTEALDIKRDAEEDKPMFNKLKGASHDSGEGLSSTSNNNTPISGNGVAVKNFKVESPIDCHIPPLSMPSPSPEPSHKEASPILPMVENGKTKQNLPSFKRHLLNSTDEAYVASRQNLPLPGRRHISNDKIISTMVPRQDLQESNVPPAVRSESHAIPLVIPASVPAKPPPPYPPLQEQPMYRGVPITNFDEGDGCRMGPDAATHDGWSGQSAVDDEPSEQRRWPSARPPQKVDHYSPSPPPPPPPISVNNRGLMARPRLPSRRVDHYSPPRRSPESMGPSGHSRNSPGLSWSRGSGSGANSRDVSPGDSAYYRARRNSRRSPTPEPDAQSGKKRMRDIQDAAGPLPRRPRYGDNRARREIGNPNMSGYEDDWSRTANYGRSPSPELRSALLSLRLEDPHSDHDQRRESRPRTISSTNNLNAINGNLRENGIREHNNDSRPLLLNRLTDLPLGGLPDIPSGRGHHPPNYKGPRARKQPYSRPNAHQQQPLEQRLGNKGSLMNRLK